MRKRILGRAAVGVVTVALAAGALVATGTASTTGGAAATASAAGSTQCILPAVKGPLAAMLAGSRHRKDIVTNQYDLPTQSGISPFLSTTHTVNVYFHVVMDGPDTVSDDDSTGDIPQQWITDQISVLNAAYLDSGFQFNLVSTDRTDNPVWFNGLVPGKQEIAMKTALREGGYWDLNVYTADLGGGLLGWATFPEKKVSDRTLAADGVVIYHESLPGGNADFGTDAVYNLGDTLTHEAGHWLSLYHTFQNGCSKKGDQVDDTPAEAAPNFTCDDINSCPKFHPGVNDLIHNFMDYGDDICLDSFTPGQTARMQTNWELRNLVPAVKNFTPGKGIVGSTVTITGSSFTDASAVYFNGTAATFTVNGDDSITATVPAGATTGQVAVTGPNGTGTSSKKFKVTL